MATTVVPTSFKVLVKMVASAFYGGLCPPMEALPPEERERALKPQNDTTGLGRILLGALTERQWVKEDDLASDLNLHAKMVRRALRYLEQEQVLQREHRKETKRQIKKEAAALDKAIEPEDEQQLKAHVVTYCALDYPRLLDALRYRLETMKKNVKKACENKEVVQKYRCTNDMCAAEFRSLDVDKLEINFDTGTFSCSICGSDIDQLIGADSGVGYTGNTAERRAYVARMQEINKILDEQLKPLKDQLALCVGQQVPDFNTFQVWMTEKIIITANERDMREKAAAAAAKSGGAYNSSYSGSYGAGGGGMGPTIDTYDPNMQVLVNVADEPSTSGAGQPAASGRTAAAAAGGAAAGAGRAQQAPQRKQQPQPPWLAARAGAGAAAAAAGGAQQHGLDAAIAAIKANPNLSEEDKQRHVAFQQQLAATRAAAQAQGKPVPVPWLQSKFGHQQQGQQVAAGAGAGGAAGGEEGVLGLKEDGHDQVLGGGFGAPVVKVEGGIAVKAEPAARVQGLPVGVTAAAAGVAIGASAAKQLPSGDQPPGKRQRLLGEGLDDRTVSVGDLEWEEVGAAAPAQQPPAAEQQQQQQAAEDDEEEWEDV